MTRLIQISIRNFKNITAIELPIKEGATILAGENGAGKSSVMDAIEALIRGPAAFPEMPIRRGASKCELAGEFDNGYKIERVIGQGGTQLKVTGPDGRPPKGGAQTFLNKLFSARAFDPNSFAEADAKTQVETVRRVTGLDTSAIDLAIKQAFDARTDINRNVEKLKAQLDAMPLHADAPANPVDVKQLVEELRRLNDEKSTNDFVRNGLEKQETALHEAITAHNAAAKKVHDIEEQITELQIKLAQAKKEYAESTEATALVEKVTRDMRIAVGTIQDPDTKPIEEKIANAGELNKKLEQNEARKLVQKDYDVAASDALALTELLEEKRAERTALVASAKMPIPGLDVTDNEVTVDGVPIKQKSHSEQMEVGVAIEAAANPELRLLVVREAYACGRARLQSIIDLATKRNFDVLLEVLDESIPGAIVIEEGAIAGAPEPTEPEQLALIK